MLENVKAIEPGIVELRPGRQQLHEKGGPFKTIFEGQHVSEDFLEARMHRCCVPGGAADRCRHLKKAQAECVLRLPVIGLEQRHPCVNVRSCWRKRQSGVSELCEHVVRSFTAIDSEQLTLFEAVR